MKKRFVALFGLILLIMVSFLLNGCKNETIKFYRESAVSKTMEKFKEFNYSNDNKIKKSSGVFIYKDTSYQNNNKGIGFGPKDINFDLPINNIK